MSPPVRRDRLLLVAFVLSGAAALGYELLWTRLLALALGHETLGVLGVLVGFFGGMAAGAAALHRRVLSVRDPVRLFAVLEVVAAGYALVSPWILHALARLVPPLLGPIAGRADSAGALMVAIVVAGAALLPATFCMGATLPALVEARRRTAPEQPGGIGLGRLYAANTLGATVGTLATVHLLLPAAGMGVGAAVLSGLGFAAAALAMRWGRPNAAALAARPVAPRAAEVDTSRDPDPDVVREPWLLLALATGLGLVGVGLEVVGVSILSQILENTIYTFADILAVYLVGTAAGAWLYARFARRALAGRPATVAAGFLVALALSVVISAIAIAGAPAMLERVAPDGSSYPRHLLAEAVVALTVFAIPTVLMGAAFTHVVGLVTARGVGRAYALNTLGAAVAPLVFGVWAIDALGYRDALFAVVYAYLLLFGAFTWFRRFKPVAQVSAILGVVAATAIGPSSLVLVEPESGWTRIDERQTPMGLVLVTELETPQGPLRRLQVGRQFRMGGARAFGERRMGHIPLLLQPRAKTALFLGVGTGSTLGAVTAHDLEHVDAVELVPAVLDMLPHFEAINYAVHEDPRVHLHAADARRFVAASDRAYDLVVADLFHPARSGAGGLYAREHFEAIRARLAPGGAFAQWLPLHQLDEATLATIVRTFVAVFPEAHALLGIYNVRTPGLVLVGRDGSGRTTVALEQLESTMQNPVLADLFDGPRDVLGAYLLDRDALVRFAGEGPLNTDLFPRVSLEAPRGAYVDDIDRGPRNLEALLAVRVPFPEGLLTAADDDRVARARAEAARFSAALGHYLEAEITRSRSPDPGVPPHDAVTAYLAAHAAAPEFAPARGRLFEAAALDGRLAEEILPVMLERTPDEPRIYELYLAHLQRIGDEHRFEAVRAEAQARFGPPQPDAPDRERPAP
jgi:spermidine synthase